MIPHVKRVRPNPSNHSAKLFSLLVLAGAALAGPLACTNGAPDATSDASDAKEGGAGRFPGDERGLGKLCTPNAGDCVAGALCAGSEGTKLCLTSVKYCTYKCNTDTDCKLTGPGTGRCSQYTYDTTSTYCGIACSDGGMCPDGLGCDVSFVPTPYCQPPGFSCDQGTCPQGFSCKNDLSEPSGSPCRRTCVY